MPKNKNNSKTARVMNLLSSKKAEPAAEDAAVGQEESQDALAAPAPHTPPIVASMAPDISVSAAIKNALEDALEGELEGEAAVRQPAPARQPGPVPAEAEAFEPQPAEELPDPQPEPVQEQRLPAPEPVQEQPSAPVQEQQPSAPVQGQQPSAPVQQQPSAPVQGQQPSAPAAEDPGVQENGKWGGYPFPEYPGYINVMQVLVEEKAPKYVQMFGLCTCRRCMEDVKALTLNNLPSKYVVLETGDLVPRLTVYETKFSSDITAQLLQACKMVHERPHHDR